ncbi:SGNH/GDSL hydrolase family protein [bacterium]|nr:SGNH/GDSL hydrolase family protein [bacterium]
MRRLFLSVIVVVGTFLCMLMIFEIASRLFWKHLSGELIPLSLEIHRQSANPLLVFELIPDSQVFQDDVFYRINTEGLRDLPSHTHEKTGSFRIAAVGDSFTFGMALPLEMTWPKQLEHLLQERFGPTVSVYNFGIMGYDTQQEIELIKTRVLLYQPDLIIIGYCLNDVGVFSRERSEVNHYKGYHEYLKTGVALLDHLLDQSRFFRFIKERLFLYRSNIKVGFEHMDLHPDVWEAIRLGYTQYLYELYQKQEVIETLKSNMVRLKQISSEHNLPIIICLFPEIDNFDQYIYAEVHRLLVDTIQEAGLLALDFYPRMSQFKPAQIRISRTNHHPNARGNEIAATELLTFIERHACMEKAHSSRS